MTKQPLLKLLSSHLLLGSLSILLSIPMLWMTFGAFAPQSELQRDVPLKGMAQAFGEIPLASWASAYLTTENFYEPERKTGLFDLTAMPLREFLMAPAHAWIVKPFISETWPEPATIFPAGRLVLWFENTTIIALLVTVLSVLINAMAGYAFARIDFPLRTPLFWLLMASIMIPGQMTLVPLFLLVTRVLHMPDSMWAIILPQLAAPVGIFLMRQYMRGLPAALEEAARIDGCSEIGIFVRVVLPLSKPILAVWATFTFIGAWKSFLWPLVITNDQNLYVLEVGLKTLQFTASARNIGIVMAAALLASIPMIITFFTFQKHLVQGLTAGGVKG